MIVISGCHLVSIVLKNLQLAAEARAAGVNTIVIVRATQCFDSSLPGGLLIQVPRGVSLKAACRQGVPTLPSNTQIEAHARTPTSSTGSSACSPNP